MEFGRVRTLGGLQDVPLLARGRDGVSLPVGLLRTRRADPDLLEVAGAFRTRMGWWRHRVEPFPFEALDRHLPRMARRSLVPQVVDLIPATSWFASLANLLTRPSWEALRAPLVQHQGGCEDCGSKLSLEAHEAWSYDDEAGVQSLDGVVVLCRQCHETRHLGFARSRGRFDQVFSRLLAINRISEAEAPSYLATIEDRWRERSRLDWELALRLPPGMRLQLARGVVHAGDGWLLGRTRAGEVSSRVVDVGVEEGSDGVWLVGLTPRQLDDARDAALEGWLGPNEGGTEGWMDGGGGDLVETRVAEASSAVHLPPPEDDPDYGDVDPVVATFAVPDDDELDYGDAGA